MDHNFSSCQLVHVVGLFLLQTSQGAEAERIKRMIKQSNKSPHEFRLKELKSATRNFHPGNKLGEGGFGKVYKGSIAEMDVAIKRLSKDSHEGKQEFVAEITTISHLEHKNLVKLMGWCCESGELLLMYKFMPNGSLDNLLFSYRNTASQIVLQSWKIRFSIICGVASALDYLHVGCNMKVLHRDVKASNVMLDSIMGDFGLARNIQDAGKTHHSTKDVAGTPGCMAPEYVLTEKASAKTDIYGFGVFLMEATCGRKPVHKTRDHENRKRHCGLVMGVIWKRNDPQCCGL
ncbi:hypothetical protein Scep_013825 [Stephania cephalantha]|uniref:Protein kinase domain-containing protein n=1 Tax=Stephania cephalantha TaxID=152367 RepID=A0AAP0J072_9MAGN